MLSLPHKYKKLGFSERKRRPNYYTNDKDDAIVMALALS